MLLTFLDFSFKLLWCRRMGVKCWRVSEPLWQHDNGWSWTPVAEESIFYILGRTKSLGKSSSLFRTG